MGIGVSLILVAAGAILTWAVDATVSGLNIHTVGLVFWSSWGGFGGASDGRRTTVIEDGARR